MITHCTVPMCIKNVCAPMYAHQCMCIDVCICSLVVDWWGSSECDAGSKDSIFVRESYCLVTLSKSLGHNCSAIRLHMCTSVLWVTKQYWWSISKTVVLYCILWSYLEQIVHSHLDQRHSLRQRCIVGQGPRGRRGGARGDGGDVPRRPLTFLNEMIHCDSFYWRFI